MSSPSPQDIGWPASANAGDWLSSRGLFIGSGSVRLGVAVTETIRLDAAGGIGSALLRKEHRGGIDFEKLEAARQRLGIEGDGERWPGAFDDPALSLRLLGREER